MAPQEILSLLNAEPFVPFRIITSDGTLTYDVIDPQHVLVLNRTVHIGILANPNDEFPDRAVRLDLLHITQLIPLASSPPAEGSGQPA
jgi:hypothetical protein